MAKDTLTPDEINRFVKQQQIMRAYHRSDVIYYIRREINNAIVYRIKVGSDGGDVLWFFNGNMKFIARVLLASPFKGSNKDTWQLNPYFVKMLLKRYGKEDVRMTLKENQGLIPNLTKVAISGTEYFRGNNNLSVTTLYMNRITKLTSMNWIPQDLLFRPSKDYIYHE